ncbi:MAG: hypothetical protein ABSC76_06775 [Terracidiphilus sp.]|jgi:hypothetical protein
MKNPDEAIDKVLAGLRDVEAPAGMERRILAAAEAGTAVHGAAVSRWASRVAMAGMIVLSFTLAIPAIKWHGHLATEAQRHALPAPSAKGAQAASAPPRELITPARTPTRIAAPRRKARPVNAADALLLAEMRAPSHPAPEEPLTNEERLLIRAVHLGDTQVMAMLNPEVRARQEAESEAEFQRFAEQSGKGDSE